MSDEIKQAIDEIPKIIMRFGNLGEYGEHPHIHFHGGCLVCALLEIKKLLDQYRQSQVCPECKGEKVEAKNPNSKSGSPIGTCSVCKGEGTLEAYLRAENKFLRARCDQLQNINKHIESADITLHAENDKLKVENDRLKKISKDECSVSICDNLHTRAEKAEQQIAELQAEIELLKKDHIVPMPPEFFFHNACSERCDMLVGPCACGAWHRADDFIEKIKDLFTSLKTENQKQLEKQIAEQQKVIENTGKAIEDIFSDILGNGPEILRSTKPVTDYVNLIITTRGKVKTALAAAVAKPKKQ